MHDAKLMHALTHHPYFLIAMALMLACGCTTTAIIIYLE